MGYPMTWRRVVQRNRLDDGDYGKPPVDWRMTNGASVLPEVQKYFDMQQKFFDEANTAMANLAGDVRRLEKDSVDEKATCTYLASRTGVDADTVAAVLKEFFAW